MTTCYTTDAYSFENTITNTSKNAKYSKDYNRRCWYYEKFPRDKDARNDTHVEVRCVYFRNFPDDSGWRCDPEVVKILKCERKF